MGDQNPTFVPHDEVLIDSITNVEQFLMFDENHDDPSLGDFLDGEISVFQENFCNDENRQYTDFPQTSSFGNPIPIPVWPVPPSPHSCTCCQTLRDIFHINGNHVLKLHVHGRLGLISHAVMEKFYSNMPPENHEYHMFDFCHESISNVKQFLVQYCDARRREGYIMLQDPLSNFYNTLCTGLDGNPSANADISLQQPSGGDGQTNQVGCLNQPDEEGNGLHKSYMALQRERAGKMKLKDLVPYFHLPMNVAAKELNLCPSAVKGICRREGMLRWPYRKINSFKGEISKKQQSLNSSDANERARASTEIQELQRKLDKVYELNGG